MNQYIRFPLHTITITSSSNNTISNNVLNSHTTNNDKFSSSLLSSLLNFTHPSTVSSLPSSNSIQIHNQSAPVIQTEVNDNNNDNSSNNSIKSNSKNINHNNTNSCGDEIIEKSQHSFEHVLARLLLHFQSVYNMSMFVIYQSKGNNNNIDMNHSSNGNSDNITEDKSIDCICIRLISTSYSCYHHHSVPTNSSNNTNSIEEISASTSTTNHNNEHTTSSNNKTCISNNNTSSDPTTTVICSLSPALKLSYKCIHHTDPSLYPSTQPVNSLSISNWKHAAKIPIRTLDFHFLCNLLEVKSSWWKQYTNATRMTSSDKKINISSSLFKNETISYLYL